MAIPKSEIGNRYGRLLVTARSESPSNNRHWFWLCVCDCGAVIPVEGKKLRVGHTNSCGCFMRQRSAEAHRTHGFIVGGVKPPEYRAWLAMKKRCYSPTYDHYADYGGRGITVCDRWLDSFEDFIAHVGAKPSRKHSLDRIDNNGNYEPGNVRWATAFEQANNRRNNRNLTLGGETMSVSAWSRRLGLKRGTVCGRIHNGWSVDRALGIPA